MVKNPSKINQKMTSKMERILTWTFDGFWCQLGPMLAPQIHQNPKNVDPKRHQKIDRFSGRSFWPRLLRLSPQVPPTWPSLAPSWAPKPANLAPNRPQIVRAPDLFFDLGSDMAPKTAQDRFWNEFGPILDEIWSDFRFKFQQIFAHVGQTC